MLASITPLGERGRQSTWAVTVTAHLLGAVAGGAGAGALAGALGRALLPASFEARGRLGVLAVTALVAVLIDAATDPAPGPRRQVNERWLDQFRGWVYGLGFGAQLGIGITTVVSSAATYLALAAALLTRSAAAGALIVGCFGAVRGLTPLAAGGVRSQRQLLDLHRALARWRARARWGAVGVEAAALAAAALTLALAGS
jgi:hypothetical protein